MCPICDHPLEDDCGCEHMVFIYELVNYQYLSYEDWFVRYFWDEWLPNNSEKFDEDELDMDDQSVLPNIDWGKMEGLLVVNYWNGYEGTQWGIADENLMKKRPER